MNQLALMVERSPPHTAGEVTYLSKMRILLLLGGHLQPCIVYTRKCCIPCSGGSKKDPLIVDSPHTEHNVLVGWLNLSLVFHSVNLLRSMVQISRVPLHCPKISRVLLGSLFGKKAHGITHIHTCLQNLVHAQSQAFCRSPDAHGTSGSGDESRGELQLLEPASVHCQEDRENLIG